MWPEPGVVYVCVNQVKCFIPGDTCVVDYCSELHDSENFSEGMRYFVWIGQFKTSLFLCEFRNSFVSQEDWRQSQIEKLNL